MIASYVIQEDMPSGTFYTLLSKHPSKDRIKIWTSVWHVSDLLISVVKKIKKGAIPLEALLEMFDTPALSCSLCMIQSAGVALVISPSAVHFCSLLLLTHLMGDKYFINHPSLVPEA